MALVILQLLVVAYVSAEESPGTEPDKKTTAQKLAGKYGWPYVPGHKGLSRQEIVFPQVRGLRVIKADLHIHTIYSDGQVLPETRVWEAWRDGLDLMVITDHPEYLKLAFPQDRDRAFGRALPLARALGLMLVRGAELTTLSRPNYTEEHSDHVVAFIQDESPFYGDFDTAVRSARDQGAVIIWAHPGPRWARGRDTAPGVGVAGRDRAEKTVAAEGERGLDTTGENLSSPTSWTGVSSTIWPSSPCRTPTGPSTRWWTEPGERRDMTLVLAESRGEKEIREAIKARRTLAYFGEMIWGPGGVASSPGRQLAPFQSDYQHPRESETPYAFHCQLFLLPLSHDGLQGGRGDDCGSPGVSHCGAGPDGGSHQGERGRVGRPARHRRHQYAFRRRSALLMERSLQVPGETP